MAYADFQKTVTTQYAPALPGECPNLDANATTAFNYVSDGTCEAGCFAFESATPDTQGTINFASKTKSGGRLLGMVMRLGVGSLNTPFASYSSVYAKGVNLTILRRGQVFAQVPSTGTPPTQGQSVLCDPATGNITYGAAGDTNDTGWKVLLRQGQTAAEAGDLVIYENLGVDVATKAAGGE